MESRVGEQIAGGRGDTSHHVDRRLPAVGRDTRPLANEISPGFRYAERMADRTRVLIAVLALGAFGACKKSETKAGDPAAAPVTATAPAGSGSAAAPSPSGDPPPTESAPATDNDSPYAKSTLTEDKLQRYVTSLGEKKSPFDERPHSFEESKQMTPKLEAFAKKYGFATADEYGDVVQRVTLARLQTGATDADASLRATLLEGIANYEKQLADPATTPEMKANLNEMITSAKQELAQRDAAAKEGGTSAGGLNATDAALVKKFDPQISAAEKAKLGT